jgi:hypothetical protein
LSRCSHSKFFRCNIGGFFSRFVGFSHKNRSPDQITIIPSKIKSRDEKTENS